MTGERRHVAATRAAYDTVAGDYADLLRDELARRPLDRVMLATFAELVGGPVLDIGCGPGRVTAHLAALGVAAAGVDLSPGMVAVARRDHPDLRFEVGTMAALDAATGSLGGIVAWYSIIHIPDAELPGVLAEFRRVLAPGGLLLLAFQVGDEVRHVTAGYGHEVDLSAVRRPVARVAAWLADAGFLLDATLVREPTPPESVPQAYLLARVAHQPR